MRNGWYKERGVATLNATDGMAVGVGGNSMI